MSPIIEFRYILNVDPLPLAFTDLSVGVLAGTLVVVESQLQQPNNLVGAAWGPNSSLNFLSDNPLPNKYIWFNFWKNNF